MDNRGGQFTENPVSRELASTAKSHLSDKPDNTATWMAKSRRLKGRTQSFRTGGVEADALALPSQIAPVMLVKVLNEHDVAACIAD